MIRVQAQRRCYWRRVAQRVRSDRGKGWIQKEIGGYILPYSMQLMVANREGKNLKNFLPQVSLNPDGKPKRGSFEIFLVKDGDVLLWSGAEKGPPRKLKFPEHTKIIELTKKHL